MIEALFAVALVAAVPLGIGLTAQELFNLDRRGTVTLAIAAAAPAIASLALPRGPVAAILAGPWLIAVGSLGIAALVLLLQLLRRDRTRNAAVILGFAVPVGFLAVGAGWLVLDRLGVQPFGFDRTIVLLTAVHFHVAGFVLTLAGAMAARERPTILSIGAVAALVVGTPLTALGFFGLPALNWIGAMLVAAGGIGIGLVTIAVAGTRRDAARVPLRIAGASLLVTMPLAAAYATGTTFAIPILDVPAMAAAHGGLNVVGFAVPAMLGWSREPAGNGQLRNEPE
jgi:hypothetical protein